MKKTLEFILDIAKMILISLAIILPIRYFLFQPFYVNGASMEPTFHNNEYLMVDEISYRFHEPERGDVIVFRYPGDPQDYYIKRLIGLPGETVQIKDGHVYITDQDGQMIELSEGYLPENLQTIASSDDPLRLDDDEYFVLGDNRNGSKDSRSFGAVKKSYIIGRVFFRAWPLGRVSTFPAPSYISN